MGAVDDVGRQAVGSPDEKHDDALPVVARGRRASAQIPRSNGDLPATSSATTWRRRDDPLFQKCGQLGRWSVAHLDFVYRQMTPHPAEIVVDGFANTALFDLAHGKNDDAQPRARCNRFGDFAGTGKRLASSQRPSMS